MKFAIGVPVEYRVPQLPANASVVSVAATSARRGTTTLVAALTSNLCVSVWAAERTWTLLANIQLPLARALQSQNQADMHERQLHQAATAKKGGGWLDFFLGGRSGVAGADSDSEIEVGTDGGHAALNVSAREYHPAPAPTGATASGAAARPADGGAVSAAGVADAEQAAAAQQQRQHTRAATRSAKDGDQMEEGDPETPLSVHWHARGQLLLITTTARRLIIVEFGVGESASEVAPMTPHLNGPRTRLMPGGERANLEARWAVAADVLIPHGLIESVDTNARNPNTFTVSATSGHVFVYSWTPPGRLLRSYASTALGLRSVATGAPLYRSGTLRSLHLHPALRLGAAVLSDGSAVVVAPRPSDEASGASPILDLSSADVQLAIVGVAADASHDITVAAWNARHKILALVGSTLTSFRAVDAAPALAATPSIRTANLTPLPPIAGLSNICASLQALDGAGPASIVRRAVTAIRWSPDESALLIAFGSAVTLTHHGPAQAPHAHGGGVAIFDLSGALLFRSFPIGGDMHGALASSRPLFGPTGCGAATFIDARRICGAGVMGSTLCALHLAEPVASGLTGRSDDPAQQSQVLLLSPDSVHLYAPSLQAAPPHPASVLGIPSTLLSATATSGEKEVGASTRRAGASARIDAQAASEEFLTLTPNAEYLAGNFPLRHAAIGPDGSRIVASGRRGLTMWNRRLGKWRLFGSKAEEQGFVVTANPVWLGTDVFACAVDVVVPAGQKASKFGAAGESRLVLFTRPDFDGGVCSNTTLAVAARCELLTATPIGDAGNQFALCTVDSVGHLRSFAVTLHTQVDATSLKTAAGAGETAVAVLALDRAKIVATVTPVHSAPIALLAQPIAPPWGSITIPNVSPVASAGAPSTPLHLNASSSLAPGSFTANSTLVAPPTNIFADIQRTIRYIPQASQLVQALLLQVPSPSSGKAATLSSSSNLTAEPSTATALCRRLQLVALTASGEVLLFDISSATPLGVALDGSQPTILGSVLSTSCAPGPDGLVPRVRWLRHLHVAIESASGMALHAATTGGAMCPLQVLIAHSTSGLLSFVLSATNVAPATGGAVGVGSGGLTVAGGGAPVLVAGTLGPTQSSAAGRPLSVVIRCNAIAPFDFEAAPLGLHGGTLVWGSALPSRPLHPALRNFHPAFHLAASPALVLHTAVLLPLLLGALAAPGAAVADVEHGGALVALAAHLRREGALVEGFDFALHTLVHRDTRAASVQPYLVPVAGSQFGDCVRTVVATAPEGSWDLCEPRGGGSGAAIAMTPSVQRAGSGSSSLTPVTFAPTVPPPPVSAATPPAAAQPPLSLLMTSGVALIPSVDRRRVLQRLVAFLRRECSAAEFHDIVIQTIRKTDVVRWRLLFHVLGPPHELFDACVALGHVTPAVHLVRVLLLEQPDDAETSLALSYDSARRLFALVLRKLDFALAFEVLRFIALLFGEMSLPPLRGHDTVAHSAAPATVASGGSDATGAGITAAIQRMLRGVFFLGGGGGASPARSRAASPRNNTLAAQNGPQQHAEGRSGVSRGTAQGDLLSPASRSIVPLGDDAAAPHESPTRTLLLGDAPVVASNGSLAALGATTGVAATGEPVAASLAEVLRRHRDLRHDLDAAGVWLLQHGRVLTLTTLFDTFELNLFSFLQERYATCCVPTDSRSLASMFHALVEELGLPKLVPVADAAGPGKVAATCAIYHPNVMTVDDFLAITPPGVLDTTPPREAADAVDELRALLLCNPLERVGLTQRALLMSPAQLAAVASLRSLFNSLQGGTLLHAVFLEMLLLNRDRVQELLHMGPYGNASHGADASPVSEYSTVATVRHTLVTAVWQDAEMALYRDLFE